MDIRVRSQALRRKGSSVGASSLSPRRANGTVAPYSAVLAVVSTSAVFLSVPGPALWSAE